MSDLRERYDFLFDGTGDLTQETLLLYVFGPLETEARQAVEQHVEECEMCRDAAEGMAVLGTKEQALALLAATDAKLLERLDALKQKVTRDGKEELINQTAAKEPVVLKAVHTQKRTGWYRYAVAASVVLVIGSAFWFFNRNMNGEMATNIAQIYKDSAYRESAPVGNKDAEENDTITSIVTDGTQPYTFGWTDTNSSPNREEGLATGTYTATVQDDNSASTAPKGKAQEPTTQGQFRTDVAREMDVEDGVVFVEEPAALEEVTTASNKYLSDALTADDEYKKNEDVAGSGKSVSANKPSTAPQPEAPSLSKGSGYDNNLFNHSNVLNTDIAIVQAQYPGGPSAVQQYFDKLTYPAPIAKGYKGVMVFEVNFDKKGKITKATIVTGLGEPYDKLLLEHLNKMPAWIAPEPNGKPVESTRQVLVEVTVR